MILSISIVKCSYASKHKSEIEFEFRVEVMVKIVFEVVIELSCYLSFRKQALLSM